MNIVDDLKIVQERIINSCLSIPVCTGNNIQRLRTGYCVILY